MPRGDLEFWNRRSSLTEMAANIRWSLSHVWAHARPQALGTGFVHLLLALQPALLIYVTQHLVDTVVAAATGGPVGFDRALPWVVAFGLTLLLTNEVLWNVRDAIHMRLEQRLDHALGRLFLTKASRLPLPFFEQTDFYDRLDRASGPGRKVERLFEYCLHFSENLIRVVSVAGMFAPVSPWITLVLLAVLVPRIRLGMEQSRMFMAFTYGETEQERHAGYVDRVLTGRAEQKEMRLFGLHELLTDRWKSMRQTLRERLMEQRWKQVRGSLPTTALSIAISVGVAGVLAWLLGSRALTPGRFVALFQGVEDMLDSGRSLSFGARQLQSESSEVGYLRDFLSLPEDRAPWTGGRSARTTTFSPVPFPRPLRQGLSVKDLSFSYPTETDESRSVLQSVTFRIAPGERVALVGDNGAGKSTLAKILLGLYVPTAGRVMADGVDYADIDSDSLASAMSAAFQDFCRFELTLGQSIGLSALGATPDSRPSDLWPAWLQPDRDVLVTAAGRGGADEIAAGLPQEYDTPVGHVLDGGRGLSGGEWQRIAVARAFTRDPELLVLDEPAAALDPVAEAELYRHFTDLLVGRTTLLISHRLGSARMADRILVLKDGRLVEEGHHDDLLAAGGVYAAMWEEQSSWYR